MGVRRLDERSVEINCPKCGVTFTMPRHEYIARMKKSKVKKIRCSRDCANSKDE